MTIAESLKRFRRELNLTQRDVAETLGVMTQVYSRYETGKYVPRADDVTKIAEAYDVTTDYLLGLSDEPRPKPPEVRDKEFFNRVEVGTKILQEALQKAVGSRGRLQDNESA